MDKDKYTILVVDDEPTNIDVLSGILREHYKVTAAIDGQKALDRCFSNRIPDLILLDVMMPGIDGYAVCKALKKDPRTKKIPIIFVTAKSQVEDEQRGLELGAIDYVVKPFSPPVILQRVKNHLVLYNQNRELEQKVSERTEALQRSRQEIVTRLGIAAEFKDDDTGMHVKRMSHYSCLIAKKMGCDEEWSQRLLIASPMHDVGKIGIPDAILKKPGKLDSDEWQIMQTHAEIGEQILHDPDSTLLRLAAEIAITHHEKWNGKGYPHNLAGNEIPISGRITAVADVFDALTSKRPYKKAWEVDTAVELIQSEAGEHFDPEVVQAFTAVLPELLTVKESFKN